MGCFFRVYSSFHSDVTHLTQDTTFFRKKEWYTPKVVVLKFVN